MNKQLKVALSDLRAADKRLEDGIRGVDGLDASEASGNVQVLIQGVVNTLEAFDIDLSLADLDVDWDRDDPGVWELVKD